MDDVIPEILINDYSYHLPEERIAKYPLKERDSSKLLVYKDSQIFDREFRGLAEELPGDALMVFNDTKVVPARLYFRKATGARIEILCLEPVSPAEYERNFAAKSSCQWKCVIGNLKKWKDEVVEFDQDEAGDLELKATLISRDSLTGTVEFSWKGDYSFSEVLEICGKLPIPPYLNRNTEEIDIERYQTLYALHKGSVAAPTAGLHFTQDIMEKIRQKGIDIRKICLHVGAGTFLPVKSSKISEHSMHKEPFSLNLDLLKDLRDSKKPIIAVGTTSVRALESLYYQGVSLIKNGKFSEVGQWAPYEHEYAYDRAEALDALVKYLDKKGENQLFSGTEIIIVPGFRFRMTDIMITNFHQPKSTLLLLIAAFTGEDWRKIYEHALEADYRFLSYGDSSLLMRSNT